MFLTAIAGRRYGLASSMVHASTHPEAQRLGRAIRARLGSILAVLPASVWVVNHLFENLLVFSDQTAWEREVTGASGVVAELLVSVLVVGPIAIHAVWGLFRMRTTRFNLVRFYTFDNLRFVLQRISALGILLFLAAHLFLVRIRPALSSERGHITLAEFQEHMRMPATLVVYLLGTLGVTFHLSTGLWGFCIHMGWVSGKAAQARLRTALIGLFVVLLVVAWAAVLGVRNVRL